MNFLSCLVHLLLWQQQAEDVDLSLLKASHKDCTATFATFILPTSWKLKSVDLEDVLDGE